MGLRDKMPDGDEIKHRSLQTTYHALTRAAGYAGSISAGVHVIGGVVNAAAGPGYAALVTTASWVPWVPAASALWPLLLVGFGIKTGKFLWDYGKYRQNVNIVVDDDWKDLYSDINPTDFRRMIITDADDNWQSLIDSNGVVSIRTPAGFSYGKYTPTSPDHNILNPKVTPVPNEFTFEKRTLKKWWEKTGCNVKISEEDRTNYAGLVKISDQISLPVAEFDKNTNKYKTIFGNEYTLSSKKIKNDADQEIIQLIIINDAGQEIAQLVEQEGAQWFINKSPAKGLYRKPAVPPSEPTPEKPEGDPGSPEMLFLTKGGVLEYVESDGTVKDAFFGTMKKKEVPSETNPHEKEIKEIFIGDTIGKVELAYKQPCIVVDAPEEKLVTPSYLREIGRKLGKVRKTWKGPITLLYQHPSYSNASKDAEGNEIEGNPVYKVATDEVLHNMNVVIRDKVASKTNTVAKWFNRVMGGIGIASLLWGGVWYAITGPTVFQSFQQLNNSLATGTINAAEYTSELRFIFGHEVMAPAAATALGAYITYDSGKKEIMDFKEQKLKGNMFDVKELPLTASSVYRPRSVVTT